MLKEKRKPKMTTSAISAETPTTVQAANSLNLALREEAETAFVQDLPALLETWKDYWVAYHGKERLGISYYPERLRRRFALPPRGRLSLWQSCFGSKRPRYPCEELTLYFIDTTLLHDEFEITNEQWLDETASPIAPMPDRPSAPV
jgi:hypothetical protein